MKNIKNILHKNEFITIILLFTIITILLLLLPKLNNNFIKTGKLYITEIMANNTYTIQDEDGDYSDYIEIYNGYNREINLNGYYLSDSEFETNKWMFPEITIKSKEYILIFASGKDKCNKEENICHTNFKLSSGGEIITFSDQNNNIINKFKYESIANDLAYGYIKNKYSIMNEPSPKAKNNKYKFNYSNITNKKLYINEYITHNQRNTYDNSGSYNDWIELYNVTNAPLELNNLYLTDSEKNLTKYKLPNIKMESNSYLLIYLSDESKIIDNQITANFKLSDNDKYIILSNGKKIIDKVKIIKLADNISYGKKDNSWYYFTMPTPGEENNTIAHTSMGGTK